MSKSLVIPAKHPDDAHSIFLLFVIFLTFGRISQNPETPEGPIETHSSSDKLFILDIKGFKRKLIIVTINIFLIIHSNLKISLNY